MNIIRRRVRKANFAMGLSVLGLTLFLLTIAQAVDTVAVKKTQVDRPRDPTYYGTEARKSIGPPPKDWPWIRGGKVDGIVFLQSPGDTSLLTPFGFNFSISSPFEKKEWIDSLQTWTQPVYGCRGMWPIDLPWDSLPPQLLLIVYPVTKIDTPHLDQSHP